MDERIKELAEYAGMKLPFGGFPNYDEFDFEKFAQLIVKDCSCVPTDMWGAGELDVHTAVQVHRQILKHFGVEA